MNIPGYDDFYHVHDCEVAYRNWGGKSGEEAERMFSACPEIYKYDFTWMGSGAFRFYYWVIDKYLRSVTVIESWEDDCALMLADGIGSHFDDGHILQDIPASVIALCDHVLSPLDNYVSQESESPAADKATLEQSYRELREKAAKHVDGVRPPEQ